MNLELRVPAWVLATRLGSRQAGAELVLVALWTFARWHSSGPAKVYCSNAALAARLGASIGTIEKRLRALRAAGWIRPTMVASERAGLVYGHELAWRVAGGFQIPPEFAGESEVDELHLPAWVLAHSLETRQAGAELLLVALWTFARWGVEGPVEVACSVDELAQRLGGASLSSVEKRLRILKVAGLIRATRVESRCGLEHGYALAWPTATEGGAPPSREATVLDGGPLPPSREAPTLDAEPPPKEGPTAIEGGAPPSREAPTLDSAPPPRAERTATEEGPDRLRGRNGPPPREDGTNWDRGERIRTQGARTTDVGSRAAAPSELDAFVAAVLRSYERRFAVIVGETFVWPIVERWQENDCTLADVEAVFDHVTASRAKYPHGPIRLFQRSSWTWTKSRVLGRDAAKPRPRARAGQPIEWDTHEPGEQINVLLGSDLA